MQEPTNPEHARLLHQTFRLQREASKEFHYALRCAKEAVARNQIDLAMHWCRYGATLAGVSNPGFFYSHEMEELLADIGRKNLTSTHRKPDVARRPERFLHVLTVAYERGGHTRAVSRWIDICATYAASERHSILISMQEELPVPTWLRDSARRGGGELIALSTETSWLQRAAEMRSRALEYDAVVLHTHPGDLLPNIAFYDRPVPILIFNHADHMFSLGTDVADAIADIRPVGHDLSMRFRSPAPKKFLLPLPLSDQEYPRSDKADARRRLGIPADALVVLTIGAEHFKFSSVLGYSFPAMVQAICAANSRVLLVAIGLSESEPYPDLKRMTNGQFMPVGFINNPDIVELYYRTADIYLDSFPCTSLTAVMDAARHGLPVQRLCSPYQPLMWCDDPGLDSVTCGATTQDEFVAGVIEWLRWPDEKRVELGNRLRAAVLRDHCGESWKSKWLDPVINALRLPRDAPQPSEPKCPQRDQFSFVGLGRASWVADWPAGMFVAGSILALGDLPRVIRFSGILHSIKPLLFDPAGEHRARKRIGMFRRLVASIELRDIFAALRTMPRSIFRR